MGDLRVASPDESAGLRHTHEPDAVFLQLFTHALARLALEPLHGKDGVMEYCDVEPEGFEGVGHLHPDVPAADDDGGTRMFLRDEFPEGDPLVQGFQPENVARFFTRHAETPRTRPGGEHKPVEFLFQRRAAGQIAHADRAPVRLYLLDAVQHPRVDPAGRAEYLRRKRRQVFRFDLARDVVRDFADAVRDGVPLLEEHDLGVRIRAGRFARSARPGSQSTDNKDPAPHDAIFA